MGKRFKSKTRKKSSGSMKPGTSDARNLIKQGHRLQKAGRYAEARTFLQQALALDEQNALACHLLGTVIHQQGNVKDALIHLRRAVEIDPLKVGYQVGLAYGLREVGDLQGALAQFEAILGKDSANPQALDGAAGVHIQLGMASNALPYLKGKVAQAPRDSQSHFNLGVCYQEMHQLETALSCYQEALTLDPGSPPIHLALGRVNHRLGRFKNAIQHYLAALKRNPKYAEAHCNLGNVLMDSGLPKEALGAYEQARRLKPDSLRVLNSLGLALGKQGALQKAVDCFEKARALNQTHPKTLNNLASILCKQGRMAEALEIYESGLSVAPQNVETLSNWLLSLNYQDVLDPRQTYAQHCRFGNLFRKQANIQAKGWRPFGQAAPLRIGYVSPDFRKHSVAYFMTALLAAHDRQKFEVFCYSNNLREDVVTQQFRELSDHFYPISHLNDPQAVALIQAHGIDILIDLAGHTAGGRLSLFAARPAPLQIAYLGYPNTSGLTQMDYRFTDGVADPPGMTDKYHTEKLHRLPNCFVCYQPPQDAPLIKRQTTAPDSKIVLGSFNNRSKISGTTIKIWSQILHQLPSAELWLKSKVYEDRVTRELLWRRFEDAGIGQARIRLVGYLQDTKDHLALYNQIDVALDTSPYNGTTTTCEALWMGVPVITLAGKVHASRVGASLLTAIACEGWIAENEAQYVQQVISLANDRAGRWNWHHELRSRMRASSLMDGPALLHDLEAALIEMWERSKPTI